MAGGPLRLLLLAAAAPALVAAGEDRRLRFVSHYFDHIWGWCDRNELTPSGLGCFLNDNTTCTSHLSDGPEDADVEVVLGNLPNGSHLQFWATYRSLRDYDILQSPVGVSIYIHQMDAFPKWWQPEFNGGNVQVNESGYATIRVRKPAVYVVYPHLVPVHVQLRVCNEDNTIMHPDTLWFDRDSQFVWTKSQDSEIGVVAARPFAGRQAATVDYQIPRPWAYVHAVNSGDGNGVVTTTNAAGELSEEIGLAKDALDVTGLESSPVYNCFVQDKYYSHFEDGDGCVDECDQEHDSEHGQCVRKEQSGLSTSHFFVKWTLQIACQDLCGRDATNETLHRVRLEAGNLLDVPFQEVILHWETVTERRLAVSTRMLMVQVTVSTRRWTVEAGRAKLDELILNPVHASDLLQLPVKLIDGPPSYEDPLDRSDVDSMGDENRYEPSYEFAMPGQAGRDKGASEDDDTEAALPLIIGLAAGVVVLGSLLGGGLFYRHQRARKQRELVEGKMVDPLDNVPPAAPAPTEIGVPDPEPGEEENNTGAGVL